MANKSNKYELIEKIVFAIMLALIFAVLIIFASVILFIAGESLPFIKSEFFRTLFSFSWRPLSKNPNFGLLPMILGTVYVGFGAAILALPISLGCACYISSSLKGKLRYIVLGFIDMLAGIPSVVYGLLGFYTIVKFLEFTDLMAAGECIFAAIITLTIMSLPYMISGYVKAFEEVEIKYGAQAQALGVSTWYSMTHLTLCLSKGNILSGYMIALSRALGETMAVMMVVGNSPLVPKLFGKGITLSGLIALEMGAAKLDSTHYHSLYTAGVTLLLLLLIVNFAIRKIEESVKKNY